MKQPTQYTSCHLHFISFFYNKGQSFSCQWDRWCVFWVIVYFKSTNPELNISFCSCVHFLPLSSFEDQLASVWGVFCGHTAKDAVLIWFWFRAFLLVCLGFFLTEKGKERNKWFTGEKAWKVLWHCLFASVQTFVRFPVLKHNSYLEAFQDNSGVVVCTLCWCPAISSSRVVTIQHLLQMLPFLPSSCSSPCFLWLPFSEASCAVTSPGTSEHIGFGDRRCVFCYCMV